MVEMSTAEHLPKTPPVTAHFLPRIKSHTLIHVPVQVDSFVSSLPVILMPDGSRFFEALHWACHNFDEGAAPATVQKHIEAVGAFIDFFYGYKDNPEVTPESLRNLLRDFRKLREKGCPQLGWKAVSPVTARRQHESISNFLDHCADAFGYVPVNPVEEVSIDTLPVRERMKEGARNQQRRRAMLGYLWRRPEGGRVRRRKNAGFQSVTSDAFVVKSFPPLEVGRLLETTHSIRDLLCFILMFYGGIRSSELCHILLEDISPFPDRKTGEAVVYLAEPKVGLVDYIRKFDGKLIKNAKRVDYLRDEYGLQPRNTFSDKHPMFAGWKGIRYDVKGYRAQVWWSRPDMGILFYALHKVYVNEVRSKAAGHHPYYFVNIDSLRSGAHYGQPMKLKSLRDRFYDACRRVGLEPGRHNGVNPHGARHFYGYFLANIVKISKVEAQRYFHHASSDSTDVYFGLSVESVRDALLKAFENGSAGDHPLKRKINIHQEGVYC